MTIHLPEDLEGSLRAVVRSGRYPSVDDALAEAVRQFLRGLHRQPGPGEDEGVPDRAGRQRENLKRLCEELEAMPAATPADGLTNRDHDRILYGR